VTCFGAMVFTCYYCEIVCEYKTTDPDKCSGQYAKGQAPYSGRVYCCHCAKTELPNWERKACNQCTTRHPQQVSAAPAPDADAEATVVAGGWKLEREESDDVPLLADQSVLKHAPGAGVPAAPGAVRPPPPAYTEARGHAAPGESPTTAETPVNAVLDPMALLLAAKNDDAAEANARAARVLAAGCMRPPPPAYSDALGQHAGAARIEALQQMVLKLLPMGFSSEQISAAWSALGHAPSEAAVIGWLLSEDTGSAAHVPSFTRMREGSGVTESYREWANTEVKLMAMGFTSGQIAAAAAAVGSQSLREITDFLLKPDAASLAPARPDARTQLVRDMKHRLKDFDEVQVDNALEAVGSAAGSGAADAHELRKWIEGKAVRFRCQRA
jgi:hypothetical protein